MFLSLLLLPLRDALEFLAARVLRNTTGSEQRFGGCCGSSNSRIASMVSVAGACRSRGRRRFAPSRGPTTRSNGEVAVRPGGQKREGLPENRIRVPFSGCRCCGTRPSRRCGGTRCRARCRAGSGTAIVGVVGRQRRSSSWSRLSRVVGLVRRYDRTVAGVVRKAGFREATENNRRNGQGFQLPEAGLQQHRGYRCRGLVGRNRTWLGGRRRGGAHCWWMVS